MRERDVSLRPRNGVGDLELKIAALVAHVTIVCHDRVKIPMIRGIEKMWADSGRFKDL